MEHTIQEMDNVLTFKNSDGRYVSYNGYAFIDEWGYCIIIVYGESRRDSLSKYLNSFL